MSELIELLKIEYDDIRARFKKASIEGKGTPQEIADRRENVMNDFFRRYFPFPYKVTKGNISDSLGKRSNSIDCVILNPKHPNTIDAMTGKASMILADGVDYAVDIKGDLKNKDEVYRVLDQFYSVKQLERVRKSHVADLFEGEKYPYYAKIPCVIFAMETYANIETLLGHICTYYEEKQLSREYQVDIIFAGDYVILNGVENYIEIDDCKEFCVFKAESEGLGVLLFLMNCFPLSEDSMFSSVTMPYLENVLKDYDKIECEEINKRIRELNKM